MIETGNESWRFKSQAEDHTTRARAVSGGKELQSRGSYALVTDEPFPNRKGGTVVVRAKTARLRALPLAKERREIAAVYPS
jgi:hypothetical protein